MNRRRTHAAQPGDAVLRAALVAAIEAARTRGDAAAVRATERTLRDLDAEIPGIPVLAAGALLPPFTLRNGRRP